MVTNKLKIERFISVPVIKQLKRQVSYKGSQI